MALSSFLTFYQVLERPSGVSDSDSTLCPLRLFPLITTAKLKYLPPFFSEVSSCGYIMTQSLLDFYGIKSLLLQFVLMVWEVLNFKFDFKLFNVHAFV